MSNERIRSHLRPGVAAPTPSGVRAVIRGDERGIALVAALLVVVLIGVMVVAAVAGTMSVTRTVTADYHSSRTFYAAEAGAEHALAQVELALRDGFLADDELVDITPPTIEGFEFSEYEIVKEGVWDTMTVTDGPFSGLYAIIQNIRVTSRAEDGSGANSGVVVGAQAQAIPLFQFAAFGHGSMEAYTGSRSDAYGRIHVNGNVYMATNDHHIHGMLTTPGKFIRDGRVSHKDKSLIHLYFENESGNDVLVDFDSEDTPDPEAFKQKSEDRLDGKLRTGAMGVDSLKPPLPEGLEPHELIRPRDDDDTDAEKATKFSWQADMYVTVDLRNVVHKNGVCAGDPPGGAATWLPSISVERTNGTAPPMGGDKCRIFPFKWDAFWDRNELRWVDAVDVDIDELSDWIDDNPGSRSTKIIYVHIISSTNISTRVRRIRATTGISRSSGSGTAPSCPAH